MAITLFHSFTIAFEGAAPDAADTQRGGGHNDRDYLIEEQDAGVWKAWENGQPIAMTPEQHEELKRRLEALRVLPDAATEPKPPGEDGTWYAVSVRLAEGTHGYRWWVHPPPEWNSLEAVVRCVQELADAPRQAVAAQNRVVVEQFFDRLAARDVEGALACCGPQIEYSSPFFEGAHARQGAEAVGAMWRAWFQMLPEARIVCDDIRAGHEHASASWTVEYTSPGSRKRIRQPRIMASMSLGGGKILQHRDSFSLAEWVSQAYGIGGSLLARSALFQKWVAARERARLAAFGLENARD